MPVSILKKQRNRLTSVEVDLVFQYSLGFTKVDNGYQCPCCGEIKKELDKAIKHLSSYISRIVSNRNNWDYFREMLLKEILAVKNSSTPPVKKKCRSQSLHSSPSSYLNTHPSMTVNSHSPTHSPSNTGPGSQQLHIGVGHPSDPSPTTQQTYVDNHQL